MNRLFFALTVAGLGTILVSISAQAGGLAFDAAGNLFVGDGYSVFKFTPDGTKSTFATGLRMPLGLCFDGKRNLFVSDGAATDSSSQRSILKFTPEGKKSTFATGISSVGMAFDRSGNLFVSQGDSLFKFTPEGRKSTFVSGLGNPIDLAVDGSGNLFVVDMAVRDARVGREIFKFSPDGNRTTFATGLHDPSGVAVDEAGDLFVSEVAAPDNSKHSILKFNPEGTQSTFTSALGADSSSGLAIDHSGNVFVSNEHSILKIDSTGTLTTFVSDWVSPDKQWEYKCSDVWAGIVKTGTSQTVLDLSENVPRPLDADVVWALDSKRFAFNYSPPHAPHTSYETIALYQLRGDKWIALPSPVDETSDSSQLAQLANGHPSKRSHRRSKDQSTRDILRVRNWTDANTAILYAYSDSLGPSKSKAAFLFTLKFDAQGNWKIVKTHQMSKKEVEEEQ